MLPRWGSGKLPLRPWKPLKHREPRTARESSLRLKCTKSSLCLLLAEANAIEEGVVHFLYSQGIPSLGGAGVGGVERTQKIISGINHSKSNQMRRNKIMAAFKASPQRSTTSEAAAQIPLTDLLEGKLPAGASCLSLAAPHNRHEGANFFRG